LAAQLASLGCRPAFNMLFELDPTHPAAAPRLGVPLAIGKHPQVPGWPARASLALWCQPLERRSWQGRHAQAMQVAFESPAQAAGGASQGRCAALRTFPAHNAILPWCAAGSP
jgi:hypothetical protein